MGGPSGRDSSGRTGFTDTEALLAAIIESSDDAIYSKNRDAIITSWNSAAERMYGYSAGEAIGRSIVMLIPSDHVGEERVILDRILIGERVEHYETERVAKDGRRVEVSLTISPLRDVTGEIIGASVVGRDVSQRRELDSLRQELDRTEFVNIVAHELKNPLATISGASELLSMDLEQLPERARKAVDLLVRQTDRAQTLIKDLLDLSRVRSARFSVELTALSLRRVVDDTLVMLIPPEGKSVDVKVDEALRVMADPARLHQIFTNLITNAYKYGGRRIRIEADRNDAMVSICVADDGPGLPDDFLDLLFQPFERASTAGGQGGSGLGLAITEGLVEAHHGTIHYEAAQPNGARFVFELRTAP